MGPGASVQPQDAGQDPSLQDTQRAVPGILGPEGGQHSLGQALLTPLRLMASRRSPTMLLPSAPEALKPLVQLRRIP